MVTAAQTKLIDSITSVLESDSRVEAAWLSGSLGRGEGDAFSDVDVLVLVADGRVAEVAASYAGDPSKIAEPVLVNALFGGRVANIVTRAWERFDLSFVEAAELSRFDAGSLAPLFNCSGRAPPRREVKTYKTTANRLLKLVNEFLRVRGLETVGIGRREYVVGVSGIELLRRMTLDLMLEENGIDSANVGGALRRNPFLTDEQRDLLENLPAVRATRESIMESGRAMTAVFLPRAKRLAAEIGMEWPTAFEQATRAHLQAQLGTEL
jgi:predicted nucleotidyltransferase